MKIIERKDLLDKLIRTSNTPDIKVITGVRRSGKSKLLEQFIKYIKKNEEANIIFIDYNLTKFENLLEYHKLIEYVEKEYVEGKDNYLLIDEVQMCDGFERAIINFYTEEKYKIYITGSNAFLLSSDLATLFTGRTFKIEIYPFSYKEYLEYYKLNNNEDNFKNYVNIGGMSGSYLFETVEDSYNYISDIYDTLIVRDIKQKYKIRNNELLTSIGNYLMDNISNITSAYSIETFYKKQKVVIDHKTISNYIDYFCNAFLFYKVSRYDIQGKKYLSSKDKFYLVDQSFKYAELGMKNMNYGRIYENLVAIELLRRGYEIFVGVLYDKEIDFVAMKQHEKIYIQVSDNISDENTFNREINSLLKINDAYPKILIANTKHDTYLYEGIQIIDISKWLSNED